MKIVFAHLGRESLGIEYLSAVLKRAGHSTVLALDPGLFGENDNVLYIPKLERLFDRREILIDEVAREKPDIVAFSAYTNTYQWCLDIARKVCERLGPEVKIVFGGSHCTLAPDVVMENECVDFTIVGEGEEPMLDLANALASGAPADNIANVWARRDGRVIPNPPRPPIADIDALPFPDKSLFARDVNIVDDYLVLTSRGCPFNCSYCCESYVNALYRHRFFRRRSVDSVMAELTDMKRRYRFREVMFNDAIFFTDKKWLGELLERYEREIRAPFRCFGKAQFLDDDIARMLKRAGCYCVEFGVQTMNERVRREVLNRRETNEQNERAFRTCDRHRLPYDLDHMFGLPGESEEDHVFAARFYRSLKMLNRLKPHNLTCFPRTQITDIAKAHGMLNDEEIRALEEGRAGDFFHIYSLGDLEERKIKSAFVNLYKLLPLIPRRYLEYFLSRRRYLKFARIPGFIVVLGQIANGIKRGDYRFFLYLRYYLVRIRRSMRVPLYNLGIAKRKACK